MENIVSIYNRQSLEFIVSLNYDIESTNELIRLGKMKSRYSQWDSKSMIVVPGFIEYPKYDDSGNVVPMTEDDKKLRGYTPLEDGDVIVDYEIVRIDKPTHMINGKWIGSPENKWIETASPEEIKSEYFRLISEYKSRVFLDEFYWRGYHQRLSSIDIQLLDSNIATMTDNEEIDTTLWFFNEEDSDLLTLDDLKSLRVDSLKFRNKVYSVERKLKNEEPRTDITYEEFKGQVIL